MSGLQTHVLLDTGVQVPLVLKRWLKSHLPDAKTAEIGELLNPCDKLRVHWANQAEIPFVGYTDIKFEVARKKSTGR